jgi:myosin heavy subunit
VRQRSLHAHAFLRVCVLCRARQVSYLVTGFLDKNKDTLQEDIVSMLKRSSIKVLGELFADEVEPEVDVTKNRGRSTLLLQQRQLQQLKRAFAVWH